MKMHHRPEKKRKPKRGNKVAMTADMVMRVQSFPFRPRDSRGGGLQLEVRPGALLHKGSNSLVRPRLILLAVVS